MDIKQKVIDLVADIFGLLSDAVKPEDNFVKDLGLDSLDARELLLTLEDQFEIDIEDEDLETLNTVQDLIDYIQNRVDSKIK